MSDNAERKRDIDDPGEAHQSDRITGASGEKRPGNSLSMHEGVPVWYDCCSCEAEPYWEELYEESCRDSAAADKTD